MNSVQSELTVYTIGHSSRSIEEFLSLLAASGVTAIADVRSHPGSSRHPQFNFEDLQHSLTLAGIRYVFLGKELGGRPRGGQYFTAGIADYEKMVNAPAFEKGIERVVSGAQKFCICLMCSEAHPLDCHRCLLVGRELHKRGILVRHIIGSGRTTTQAEIESELLRQSKLEDPELFAPQDAQMASAYRARSRKVAFSLGYPEERERARL